MIITIAVEELMRGIPPTLREREGRRIHEMCWNDFKVRILQARNDDGQGNWGSLAVDASQSNKLAVYQMLQTIHAASVTLQKTDMPLYFSDNFLAVVTEHWDHFRSGFENLAPDAIEDTVQDAGRVIFKHRPAEAASTPISEEEQRVGSETYRRTMDEVHMDIARAQREEEEAAREYARKHADPWEQS